MLKVDFGRRFSSEHKVLLAYVFAMGIVIASAVVVSRALALGVAGSDAALHISQVINLNETLRDEVRGAVEAEREYLILGDEHALLPYTTNVTAFQRTLTELHDAVMTDREQLDRLGLIQALFARWRAEVAEPEVAARRAAPTYAGAMATAAHAIVLQLQREARQSGQWDAARTARWTQMAAALKAQIIVGLTFAQGPVTVKQWTEALDLANQLAGPTGAPLGPTNRLETMLRTRVEDATLASAHLDRIFKGRIGSEIEDLLQATAASIEDEGNDLRVLFGKVDNALSWARVVTISGSLGLFVLLLGAMLEFRVVSWQAQSQSQEMLHLNQLGELLQACRTFDEAWIVIERFARLLFPQRAGVIYLVSSSRDLAESVVSWGEVKVDNPVFTPDQCWAIRRGQVHLVDHPHAGMACRHLPDPLPGAYMCLPLVAQNEMLGILTLLSVATTDKHAPALRSQNRLARALAEQIGSAVSNLRLRETLRNQSIRDPLTGLFNRRYLEETVERELRRAERHHTSLGVIMLDIDHFKQFNDRFGHDGGDALLRELGPMLQKTVRKEDIACRYGGEEFLLALPDASFEDTVARAEQLQNMAQALDVVHRGRSLDQVTLSLGVAVFPTHGTTTDILIRAADTALYRAKQNGRSRVEVA